MINKLKSKKGITLIALVITIIVLLILAGVTISALTGSGLFGKAKLAKQETEKKEALEHLRLIVSEVQIEKKGEATFDDFLDALEEDTDVKYIVSSTKSSKIEGGKPQLSSEITEIYVTYNGFEFQVDKNLNVEFVGGEGIATTGGSSSGSSNPGESGSGSPVSLGDCNRYIKVKISSAIKNKMTLSVDIQETDNIKAIHYFVDDKEVHSGLERTYTVTNLENNKKYKAYAVVEYENKKEISEATIKDLPEADIYVDTTGNDTTGDGSVDKPYATLKKAIEEATTENKIYVCPGTYNLEQILRYKNTNHYCVGVADLEKKLEIFGDNENTILIYEGEDSLSVSGNNENGGNAVCFDNKDSILRNVTYIFKPNSKSGNAQRAMFSHSLGNIKNVFFRISGSYKASYTWYYNAPSNQVSIENCTFFHDLGSADSNWSGNSPFTNIATNVNTEGTNTNVQVQPFGNASDSLSELITKSKNNELFKTKQAGVFNGNNAWK